MLSREEFLDSIWIPYPKVSDSTNLRGRLILLTGEWYVHLGLDGNLQKLGHTLRAEEIPEVDAQEIFRSGDWVEVLQNNVGDTSSFVLLKILAPCLKEVFLKKDFASSLAFSNFIFELRKWYVGQGFIDVQTPTLVTCPGTEPFLDSFSTEWILGSRRTRVYLPTSPELHLKKAIAFGLEKIFEIRPCFRNGELSSTHQPEFFMCEWYRAFCQLDTIKADLVNLIHHFQPGVAPQSFITKSVSELFDEHLKFQLRPTTTAAELKNLCESLDLRLPESNQKADPEGDFDDLFYFLYVEKIEPELKFYQYLFLEKYPPSQAALVRLTDDGWGDRFEFYVNGIEVANAFHELNDPRIQRQRFYDDNERKRHLGKEIVPLDDSFLAQLEVGMPPASGVALGVERLFMSLFAVKNIADLKFFPYF